MKPVFEKIKTRRCRGILLKGQKLFSFLREIDEYNKGKIPPFYQWVPHRRVYYQKQTRCYIKVVDEKNWFESTARKYSQFYHRLCEWGIATPELVAAIDLRQNSSRQSVVVTREITNALPFHEFLFSNQEEAVKLAGLRQLAQLAAQIHTRGFYFSMSLPNLYISQNSPLPLSVILLDLEHGKPAGFFAKRRIVRNLRRFQGSFLSHLKGKDDYLQVFFDEYKKALN